MNRIVRALAACLLLCFLVPAAASAGHLTWGKFADVKRVDPANPDANTLACPTVNLCVAGLDGGEIGVTTNPTATPPTWTHFTLPVTAGSGGFTTDWDAVRCTSTTACTAFSDAGDIFTTNNPASAASWTKSSLGMGSFYTRQAQAVSCPASCYIASKFDDEILIGGIAGPFAATASPALPDLSCTTDGFCIAPGGSGGIRYSSQPGAGADKWKLTPGIALTYTDGNDSIDGIWCAPTFCLAGGHGTPSHKGGLYWSTNPSGTTADWHSDPEFISEVSRMACSPSGARCVAWKSAGAFVFDSSTPTAGVSAWAGFNVTPTDYVAEVSCPTANTCFALSLSADFNAGVDASVAPDPTVTPTATAVGTASPTATASATPTATLVPISSATPAPSVTPVGTAIVQPPFIGPLTSSPPSSLDGGSATILIHSPFDGQATVRMVPGHGPINIDAVVRRTATIAVVKKKPVIYGSGSGHLTANADTKIKVRLTRKAKKFFQRHAKAKVTFVVKATPTDTRLAAKTTTVKATIKHKRKKS